MMEFLSYIMPKLAWVIPVGSLFFAGYIAYKISESNKTDTYIKDHGINIDATITEVNPDEIQEVNNRIVALVSVKYNFGGMLINAKRGLRYYLTDKEKFKPGKMIGIRVHPDKPTIFYYIGYENGRL